MPISCMHNLSLKCSQVDACIACGDPHILIPRPKRCGEYREGGKEIPMELIEKAEMERCGCSVTVFTVPLSRSTMGPDIVVRYRCGVSSDCTEGHSLGAKIVKGSRKQRRREYE